MLFYTQLLKPERPQLHASNIPVHTIMVSRWTASSKTAPLSALSRTQDRTRSNRWNTLSELLQVNVCTTEASLNKIKRKLEDRVEIIVGACVSGVESRDQGGVGAD